MKNGVRFLLTILAVFTVFAYSAMQTVPALADDGAPPVDAGTSDPQPVVDSGSDEPAVPSEVTSPLPEGTTVVILDEAGNSVPLATQEAAQSLVDGDPMWCPAGVAPKPGLGGCSASFDRFGYSGDTAGSLIDWLFVNQPNKAGTIWVGYDYDISAVETAGDIIFSGSSLTQMSAFALTIQGGWEGSPLGSTALHAANPYSYFNKDLQIFNWNGPVTINNIVFDGVQTNSSFTTRGLVVNTGGNITLNNVTVNNSINNDVSGEMVGAFLDNGGTVTINNSDFSGNEADGLIVNSDGTITTNGLMVNFNGGNGALLVNTFFQNKAVTLKGFKQFNNNGGIGLQVLSNGMITLANIVANNNTGQGIHLDNTGSAANYGITLSGTNFTMDNGADGAVILSHGAITASNMNASGNAGAGAILDNCNYSGPNCNVIIAKAVKLTGVNTFNSNGTSSELGLIIQSFGAISVSNLTASDNLGNGAFIKNQYTNFNGIDSSGTLTLSGYATFKNNGGSGLDAYTLGNAALANINASDNSGEGLHLEVLKATGGSGITLSGINNFMVNGSNGLQLLATGMITLNNVTASWNFDNGAVIINSLLPNKPYNVTLKGTNMFNHNDEDGLFVDSYGAILINNLMANDNGEGGSSGSGVILSNCSCTPKAVTITGYVTTSDNYESGLVIDSGGAVTLNNVTAEWNNLGGVYIQNNYDPLKGQTIALKGSNMFNYNGENGLEVYSYGSILVNNLTANNNGASVISGDGALLDNCNYNGSNCDTPTPKTITITGYANASNNYEYGLLVQSTGVITVNNITAEWNGDGGAYLNNLADNTMTQGVTIKGSNIFNHNNLHDLTSSGGLQAYSYGAITASNISAFDNNGYGAYLDNTGGVTPKNITLTGANAFVGNTRDGLFFNASGAAILSRINADGNDPNVANAYVGNGINGSPGGDITLSCIHTTGNLEGSGYFLSSPTHVTIKGIYSSGNGTIFDTISGGPIVVITKPCLLP